jgi:hypothetical protein
VEESIAATSEKSAGDKWIAFGPYLKQGGRFRLYYDYEDLAGWRDALFGVLDNEQGGSQA